MIGRRMHMHCAPTKFENSNQLGKMIPGAWHLSRPDTDWLKAYFETAGATYLLWRTKFCRLQPKLESTFFFFRISSITDFYWTYPTISPNHGPSNVYKHSEA